MDELLYGRWRAVLPNGDILRYQFGDDGFVLWTVAAQVDPGCVRARYVVDTASSPHTLDIFDFEVPELSGFRFLAIYQHQADGTIRLYGEPRPDNQAETRPSTFLEDAVTLYPEPSDLLT